MDELIWSGFPLPGESERYQLTNNFESICDRVRLCSGYKRCPALNMEEKEEDFRHKDNFSRATGNWSTVPKTYPYIDSLIMEVINERELADS